MERLTTLYINKERHKFSAAHYTIFSGTSRERLHGHNYSVSVRIVAPIGSNGFSADYNLYKSRLDALCTTLDEYMLLARYSPYQKIEEEGIYYRVTFDGVDMLFLRADTLLLPVTNVTIEELSHLLLLRLIDQCEGEDLQEVELKVASGSGQSASSTWVC